MTKISTGYKFNHGDIVRSGNYGYIGKIYKHNPSCCPEDDSWLEMQAIPIKAEHVRQPWYGILLIDGGAVSCPEHDIELFSTSDLFDMYAKPRPKFDEDDLSETSDDESNDESSDESSDDESNASSESESHSESDNSTQNNNVNDNNNNKCEYIVKLMLTPAELLMIGETKPVVSFTMNNKSISLTANGNPYDYPLVYMYP